MRNSSNAQWHPQADLLRRCLLLPLDEVVSARAVFVIMYRADGWAETLLEPAK